MNFILHFTLGPIGDSKLLQVSRKVGKDWVNVGNMLKLPEEEMQELQEITDEQMAAFRMLWSWRDSSADRTEEDLRNELVVVLRRAGRSDLITIFNRESSA